MATAMEREQSGVPAGTRVAGQAALGRAVGLLSGAAFIAAVAAIEGPDTLALTVGVTLGLVMVLLERCSSTSATASGVRRADEVTAPVEVARERWWDGPLAFGTGAAFVVGLASAVSTLLGDGAAQAGILGLVLGLSGLMEWSTIRRMERAREGVAVELASADPDEDPPVVLYRRPDIMAAFGR
ncbi:MAG: hypothetical protein ACEQSX_00505 [Baekduiaceae bacterium]